MGCGASVSRSKTNGQKTSTSVPSFMASLQGHMPNHNIQGDEETKMIHVINLDEGEFRDELPPRIECDDVIEFRIIDKESYDIYQVYKDGNDYYRVDNGYELKDIKTRTAENDRRLLLSLALNQEKIEIYFCIIPSKERNTILSTRKCPKKYCEKNRLTIQKCEIKFVLTDEKDSHKVYIHKGDTVEIEWTSKTGAAYRIVEKRYCPVSGGLYNVEHKGENPSTRPSARGKYSKTFNDFGMSFLFRLTDTNQIHDVIVCIVNDTYKVKHVEVKENNIEPNIIWIEQSDWIVFEWNTKRKQTVVQIDPFSIDDNEQKAMESCVQFREKHKSIELKKEGHFYWPNEPSRRGFMVHQFNETGLFCYKTENNHIGTIVVEPRKNIYHVPIFGEQLTHKMNTKDLIQFDWKMTDSEEESVLITIDAKSSVVPDAAHGLAGVFDCATHKCTKAESFFRHHFHTCEAFLLNVPQHGLYNFSITDKLNYNLVSLIVENGIDNHRVLYDENNQFEPQTLIINRGDQVWFDSASASVGSIHRTDEFGNRLESERLLFQPQENSVNYFMKDFQHEGVFYYSSDLNNDKQDTTGKPLAVIVLPDVRFHYQAVHKDEFDSEPILTNINDFVIWQFDHTIAHNLIQLDPDEKLQDLIRSHDRAEAGRNRQCLGLECHLPGTFFFSNPEFERGTGLDQHRLVSTVIIDRPFSQNCFIVTNREFIPRALHIAENDTVSWTIAGNDRNHQIYVQYENEDEPEEDHDTRQDIEHYVPGIHHLHTFNKPGKYTIRSDRLQSVATVHVYTEETIRSQKRRVHEPKFVGEIDPVSHFGTPIQLSCPDRNADIYYTVDGSMPTRHFDNVQQYNPDTGVLLNEAGLRVIRAYSVADQKISSSVITSPLTFVMESKENEAMEERRVLWKNLKINLTTSLQRPNKLYGKIDVEPTNAIDLIDYFELYVNDVAQKTTIPGTDTQFSAEGFAGGEQYRVHVVAHVKNNITDVDPIASNTQAFEIQREVQGGAPLVSLSVSNERNVIYLLWAHIGDHVSEYVVYVDNIEIKTLSETEFNNFYAIQFHGPQPNKKYLIHVEAKIKANNDIRKSNSISVSLPLEIPFQGSIPDRHFPYIVIKNEAAPSDARLETVQLSEITNPQPEPERTGVTLPISNGLRNAIPRISYKRNPNGITLFWKTKTPAIADSIEYYRIVVDNEPYGKLISPRDETKYHVSLTSGTHECYLELLPKDKNEEVYKTNVLQIDIAAGTGLKSDVRQRKEPSSEPISKVLEQKDVPIPKLNIQSINSSSIRVNWYLDRPMPSDAFAALYEVHVQGQDFPMEVNSDEQSKQDGYTEHIWHTNNPPLEIAGISDRLEYTIFVRALFHVQGLTDIDYLKTTSNRVITTSVDPLIDLLPRPLLQVTRVGLQMASLQWKLSDTTDEKLVKGYRIIFNSKPTEILPADQLEYELTGLKPDTENEVQVSVTSNPDFVDEKISEPIRIVCPPRPLAPKIESTKADKPFSIAIKWKHDRNDQDDVTSYKVFLNGKLHGEVETNGLQSFKYDLNKLNPEQTHSIYIKSVIGSKKLQGNVRQCGIESNASNELLLKCAVPPKGTTPKLDRLDRNGIVICWDVPEQFGDVKLTGYQILQNDRAIGKPLPPDVQRTFIKDLEEGYRYSFRVVPLTDQPGGVPFRIGEEYNPDRHCHYLPGPKLEVEFKAFIQLPADFRVENITGHSALVWWNPIDESSSSMIPPDGYTIRIWNNKDIKADKPMTVKISKDKSYATLKDLDSGTKYEVQLEVHKKRRHPTTNDEYSVVATTEVLTFVTGSPPDAPTNLRLIASTNTDARIGFDSFVEHNAEVKAIRVQCEPTNTEVHTKEISFDIQPDSTEFTLTNLTEHTDYKVTIYGLTDEYLNENNCKKFEQLPKKLKPSDWLPNRSFEFKTSGYDPVSKLNIRQATTESIQLGWKLPKVYGSTKYISQVLRWKSEHSSEEQRKLDRSAVTATIPGPLPSGLYSIYLDSIFSVRVNLEEFDDESTRNEFISTVNTSVPVRFQAPGTCERPEIYLTGYTTNTIDLSWNKPNLFNVIDHPEKNNEQLRIHRRLLGYQVDINGRPHHTLDEDQHRCTLTECKPGEKYEVQLTARTTVQNEYLYETAINEPDHVEKPDETPSKKLRVRMLKSEDLLQSLQANFEFNHTEDNESKTKQDNVIKPLGKINVLWTVSNAKDISHFILQWHSSKDLNIQQKTLASNETSTTIDSCDEKHHYVIEIIIVTNDGARHQYEKLTVPIPGEPDAPKLWLIKTIDTSFTVEWSEPKSYGIPIIGFQLFIAGKRVGDLIAVNLRRAEIPSRINRTYQVNVCAVTNSRQRPLSLMSQTLPVITTPTTNLVPTIYFGNDDGNSAGVARIIPLQIETINEEKVHLDWTSFLPTAAVRGYYVHYKCLNNGDVQAMKVSKRFRHTVLRGLRPGFTYGIMIIAVDKNGGVLYTSDKSTIQMNAPPNAPIVSISERVKSHVKLQWCQAIGYGDVAVVGYKIYVNNRLAANLRHDQLTYTLTNGRPCEVYTVHVQALSSDKNIVSPMSRGVKFAWPGIKPGAFRRIDDGQTGNIIVAWEHPKFEDESEKLLGYKLYLVNMLTGAEHLVGEYDAATQQATIQELNHGKYSLRLLIEGENNHTMAGPIVIASGRFNSLLNRQASVDVGRCFHKNQRRLRSPTRGLISPQLRHVQPS